MLKCEYFTNPGLD